MDGYYGWLNKKNHRVILIDDDFEIVYFHVNIS